MKKFSYIKSFFSRFMFLLLVLLYPILNSFGQNNQQYEVPYELLNNIPSDWNYNISDSSANIRCTSNELFSITFENPNITYEHNSRYGIVSEHPSFTLYFYIKFNEEDWNCFNSLVTNIKTSRQQIGYPIIFTETSKFTIISYYFYLQNLPEEDSMYYDILYYFQNYYKLN